MARVPFISSRRNTTMSRAVSMVSVAVAAPKMRRAASYLEGVSRNVFDSFREVFVNPPATLRGATKAMFHLLKYVHYYFM